MATMPLYMYDCQLQETTGYWMEPTRLWKYRNNKYQLMRHGRSGDSSSWLLCCYICMIANFRRRLGTGWSPQGCGSTAITSTSSCAMVVVGIAAHGYYAVIYICMIANFRRRLGTGWSPQGCGSTAITSTSSCAMVVVGIADHGYRMNLVNITNISVGNKARQSRYI